MPTYDELIAVMREVRDASSRDLNPHDRDCAMRIGRSAACGCSRAQRHIAAWRAFHAALDAAGVPRLADLEAVRRAGGGGE